MHYTIKEGHLQIDGRRYVTETHFLDNGEVREYEWLGDQPAVPVADTRQRLILEELLNA